MKKNNVEQKVLNILRESALKGSDREISLYEPMGEVGLDSLALVEFVTALEQSFNVEFPDNIWTDKNQLTLHNFIGHIKKTQQPDARIVKKKKKVWVNNDDIPKNKFEKVLLVIRKKGFWPGILWLFLYFLYRIEIRYILTFDLAKKNIPDYNPTLNLKFTVASNEDFNRINEIYPNPMSIEEFNRRLNSEYLCFLAWHENKVVAVDWIAGSEHFDPITGLTFKMKNKSCYGMELFEKNGFKGKGVGLALLVFSLKESKRLGYEKSIIWVDADNLKMLNASVHILDHDKIGEIIQTKIFLKPFTKWSINGQRVKSKLVIA